MGKIKKILENELVGGTQTTDVYPVTSVKAVYDENNERLDHILNRRGVVNISTNYNDDHIAEVLTLFQAINKVPASDKVLGFQGKYLASDSWHTIIYTGDSLTSWSDTTKWVDLADKVFKSISKNATFGGIATPTTNPDTPDGPVFYIATQAGVYINFNSIEVAKGEAVILQWNGGTWIKVTTELATEQEIIYDVSARNGGVGFESLSALLNSSNLSILIPTSVRRGGITIRFIQGSEQDSDKKYMQYRLMAEEFTTDTTQWAIADEGVYVENPEFVYVKTDNEGKILWAIKTDGGIYYGAGVPQQVIDYINEKIAELSLDEYEDIVAFLNGLEEGDKTLQTLLNEKVDKEEGKSLIEDEVKECFRVIENEEFIKAIVDADDKVLFGIYRATGKPYFPLNEMYHVIQNEEYFALWLDSADHVLLGIRRDGQIIGEIHAVNALKQVISQLQSDVAALQEKVGTIDTNLKELLDVFSLQDNEEYLAIEQDSEGKILSATNPDGSHYIHNAKSETIPTEFKHIEDPEGRTEITTDAENKVMSWRDSSGKKHEHDMEITNLDVSNLNLQGNSVNNIQDALKANGFEVKSKMDWSDLAEIHIPEPQCAFVNLTGELPINKGYTTNGVIDFYDMQGNYFKKYVEIDIHGRTSALFKKKNYTLDFFNNKEHSESFSIKFGDWVAMDSYYFQGWYSDAFRGIDIIGYKLYQQIIESRGYLKDRPYKYHILKDIEDAGNDTHTNVDENLGKNALCTPMGFPVVLYLNGNFFGIYTIMLKKNRVNFLMSKKDYNAVMIDPDNGSIVDGIKDWTSFEIRNPKTLICMDGTKYDGDNPKELIDESSEKYSASNKDMVNTVKTKNAIISLADAYTLVKEAVTNNKSNDEVKALIEKYYNVDYIIDYIIFSNIIQNTDGWGGNWQWTTWDGIKWNPNPYDLNATFGLDPYGIIAHPASGGIMKSSITNIVYDYYLDVIKQRYAQLRQNDIISLTNIVGLFNSWCKRIGAENFNKEFEKWNTSPSQRSTNINTTYWERVSGAILPYPRYSNTQSYSKDNIVVYEDKLYKSLKDGNVGNDVYNTEYWEEVSYNAEKEYNIGDTVLCSSIISIKFQCIKACVGQSPVKLYNEPLGILGFYDSIGRIYKWVEKKITLFDSVWKYNEY